MTACDLPIAATCPRRSCASGPLLPGSHDIGLSPLVSGKWSSWGERARWIEHANVKFRGGIVKQTLLGDRRWDARRRPVVEWGRRRRPAPRADARDRSA